jgi:hypothetical protein
MIRWTVDKLDDVGLRRLTGEACGIGLRGLYAIKDMETWTKVCEFLGLPQLVDRPRSFPGPSEDYVATVMLPNSYVTFLALYLFLARGAKEVIWVPAQKTPNFTVDEALYVRTEEDDTGFLEYVKRGFFSRVECRRFVSSGDAVDGMRYRHQWTGATQ